MEFEYGYDGKHSPWHADTGGYVTHLELDNLEACLSALWIKTGYWLTKKGREKLAICKRESRLLSNDVFANNELWLTISLRGKKVESHVLVDTTTWLPKRMEMKAFGGVENWEFANWTKVLPGYSLKFCMSTMYLPATGGEHHYLARTTGIAFHDDSPDVHVYDYHQTHLRPRAMDHYPRIQLDSSSSPSAKMIRVRSGHHLVRPLIDGKDMGYFIVDTGASGLVISRRKADELGMHAYGELYITGVEGKFKTRYRRSKSLQLGPLKISFPVFIEAPSDNIVKGVTEAVSGILGYDIFCRTIVEMSSVESRITFYDPLQFQPSNLEVNWKVVHMLDNTPHAEVKFLEQCALLMLDTGAGGIGVILHKRAVEEFDLLSRLDWKGQIVISGVGKTDESGGIKVQHGTLNRMEVGGQVFERVKTLYFDADDQVVDISIYNSGIVCGEIIMRHVLVLDYPNNRFAFVRSS
ncbi:hypothetical protein KP509_14G021400 [Ceratopteris richardii]|nr:hypothetical protein KP509_14G021400 [Ceratopteris richardii]